MPCQVICQESKSDLYAEILDSITINLRSGESAKNIQYISDLEKTKSFDGFDCQQIGTIYHKLGQAHFILSDHQSAYTNFTSQTIPIWNDCPLKSKIDEAHSYYAASISGQYLNYFDEAIPLMNTALELYESDSSYTQFNLARKYHGAGRLYSKGKDYELAEIYYLQSLDIFSKSEKGERYLSQVYNDFGVLYQNKQEYEQAIKQYEKSLDQNDSYKTENLHNIANAYIELEDYKSAEKYALLTYDSALENGDAAIEARTLELIGFVRHLLNNQTGAQEAYHSQIDILENVVQNNETIRYLAKAHDNIAVSYVELNDFDSAIESNQKALDYMFVEQNLDRFQNPIIADNYARNDLETIDILSTKADILKQKQISAGQSISSEAEIDLYFKIDSLFLRVLSDASFARSKFYLLNKINPLYENATSSLHENYRRASSLNYFNKAYYFASRLKAITLRTTLQKETILNQEENEKLYSYQKTIDSLKLIYYNSTDLTENISSKIIRQQRLIHDYEKSIGDKYPELSNAVGDVEKTEYQKISQELSEDKILIEYFQGDSSLYSFFMTTDTFGIVELNFDEEIQEQLNEYIEANKSPTLFSVEEYRKLSHHIFNILMKPILANVASGINKVLVIPDGILHSIPFEAWCVGDWDFMLENYEFSYAYSYHLKEPVRNKKPKGYVGFAANYTKDLNSKILKYRATKKELVLTDIPLAIEEIKTSAKIFDGNSFLNEHATKTAFLEHSARAKIIHISTHGIIDNEVPENSNLLFSDISDDFILHSSEISTLNLNADLVVLSACQSAAGKTVRNEGVEGITRSFLLAGTSSVISSLWDASDYTSSVVLPLFFENYVNGKSKSESLQSAKLEYLKKSRPSLHHPFYWSNLILIVNPSTELDLSQKQFEMYNWSIVAGVMVAFLFAFILYRRRSKN